MRTSRRRRLFVATLALLLLFGTLAAASAQEPPGPDLELVGQPEVSGRVTGGKASSSALAQTDPALLARSDAGLVNVVIKLDYDASASYTGNIEGLAATSPSVTGRPLTGKSTAEREYDSFAAAKEAEAVDELQQRVPSADVGRSLRVVYGGVAAVIPANSVEDVLAIPGVVAVQVDELEQPLTDSSPDFLSAGPVYDALGGTDTAGAGVIYGNLDTGVWPEHQSFADLGNLSAPPPTPGGTGRACNFGDNPLTPANDPFVCTNKLIGGQPFLATYLSDPGRAAAEPFHTARDSNGHGTHTSSTTAGNMLDSAMIFGVERGPIHGIAPGAHLIGVQGVWHPGVLRLRYRRRRAAGDPRRRRRDQLLDLGRDRPVHRPDRARLPRRLRRRRVRLGVGGQRRARSGDGQPPRAVGHHGGGVDPDP